MYKRPKIDSPCAHRTCTLVVQVVPNRLSNEDWNQLVAHLRVQIVDEGRFKPDFMRAQRATGIDRRTVKAHWEGRVEGHPCLERFFKRQDERPAPTRPPASPKSVAVPTPTPTPTPADVPGGVASPPAPPAPAAAWPLPAVLAAGPLAGVVQAVALDPAANPLDQLRAASIAALKDEQGLLEGQHNLGKGILNVTTLVLQALYESIPTICLQIKTRLGENPKEGIALLRELMEISEKLSKTHGRNVETQRLIAGVPTSHAELTVRREGPTIYPDADDERLEQARQLKGLIRAEARRIARAEGYAAEGGEFIEVEVEAPVRDGGGLMVEPTPVVEPSAAPATGAPLA